MPVKNARVPLSDVERHAREYFTREEQAEIEVRLQAFQESIDEERENYGDEAAAELGTPCWYTAINDWLSACENYLKDASGDSKSRKNARKEIARILGFLVRLGVYQPISEAEADDRVRGGVNVKKSHFPLIDGQRYEFEAHPEGWR